MSTTSLPVDALLFDLGNVLIPIDFNRVFQVWSEHSGVPKAVIANRFSADRHYQLHEMGTITHSQYFAALRETLDLDISDQAFLEGWNAIFLDPHPGMALLLNQLASLIPLYLFSNTNAIHQLYWQKRYQQLLSPLTELYCSNQLGQRKPDPEAFLIG